MFVNNVAKEVAVTFFFSYIERFVYSTPFTESGKAHGDLRSQYKRKTILTTENTFPYVKTRVPVIEREEVLRTQCNPSRDIQLLFFIVVCSDSG